MIINSNGGRQLNNTGLKVGDKIKIMRPDLMWDNTIYFNEYGLCDKEEFEKLKINPIPDFKSGNDEYFNKGDIGTICYEEDKEKHWGYRKYYISIKKKDNNGVEFDLYSHLFSLKEIGEFAEKIEDNNITTNSDDGKKINSNNNDNKLKSGDKIRITNLNNMWDAEIYFHGCNLDEKGDLERFGTKPIPDFDNPEFFREGDIGFIRYEEDEKEHWNDKKYCISIEKYDNNEVIFKCSSNVFSLDEINKFTEKVDDIQDISPSTTQKVYQGWELMKFAQETYGCMEFDVTNGNALGRCDGLKVEQENILFNNKYNENYPSIHLLLNNQFVLRKEQKLVTFDEARKSGKSFKYKDWDDYEFLDNVLAGFADMPYSSEQINQILDEKAWMINE